MRTRVAASLRCRWLMTMHTGARRRKKNVWQLLCDEGLPNRIFQNASDLETTGRQRTRAMNVRAPLSCGNGLVNVSRWSLGVSKHEPCYPRATEAIPGSMRIP